MGTAKVKRKKTRVKAIRIKKRSAKIARLESQLNPKSLKGGKGTPRCTAFLEEWRKLVNENRIGAIRNFLQRVWEETFVKEKPFPFGASLHDVQLYLSYELIHYDYIESDRELSKRVRQNYRASRYLLKDPRLAFKMFRGKEKKMSFFDYRVGGNKIEDDNPLTKKRRPTMAKKEKAKKNGKKSEKKATGELHPRAHIMQLLQERKWTDAQITAKHVAKYPKDKARVVSSLRSRLNKAGEKPVVEEIGGKKKVDKKADNKKNGKKVKKGSSKKKKGTAKLKRKK